MGRTACTEPQCLYKGWTLPIIKRHHAEFVTVMCVHKWENKFNGIIHYWNQCLIVIIFVLLGTCFKFLWESLFIHSLCISGQGMFISLQNMHRFLLILETHIWWLYHYACIFSFSTNIQKNTFLPNTFQYDIYIYVYTYIYMYMYIHIYIYHISKNSTLRNVYIYTIKFYFRRGF